MEKIKWFVCLMLVFSLWTVSCSSAVPPTEKAGLSQETIASIEPAESSGINGEIVIIFGNRFISEIYQTIRPMFEEAGYQVTVASKTLDEVTSKDGTLTVKPDELLSDLDVSQFSAVVFSCDNDIAFGSAQEDTNRIIHNALNQEIHVAAICAAPRVLGYADVVQGVNVTAEPSETCALLQEEHGAICTGNGVEQDDLIITAKDKYSRALFAKKIIEVLQSK